MGAARVERARELAERYPAAREILERYAALAVSAPEPATACECETKQPVASVLRDGLRSLLCAECGGEWPYPRIECPFCHEQAFDKLPRFADEARFPHIRVEACDACRCYLLSVDLSKDGHAVPEVEELAAVSLNLWAQEQGYVKRHANVMGL
jgi:FdhE protein